MCGKHRAYDDAPRRNDLRTRLLRQGKMEMSFECLEEISILFSASYEGL